MHPNSPGRSAPQAGTVAAARVRPGAYGDTAMRQELSILRDLKADIAAGTAHPRELKQFSRLRQALKDRTRGRALERRLRREAATQPDQRLGFLRGQALADATQRTGLNEATKGQLAHAVRAMSNRFRARHKFPALNDRFPDVSYRSKFLPADQASAANLRQHLISHAAP